MFIYALKRRNRTLNLADLNKDNHATMHPSNSSSSRNCFSAEYSDMFDESKEASLSSLQKASLVRFNITSNPMELAHKGSSTVTFSISDDQKIFIPEEDMGRDIRACHSSPCFTSYDDQVRMFGPREKRGEKNPRRRGSSPEDNSNKYLSSSHIRKELRYYVYQYIYCNTFFPV